MSDVIVLIKDAKDVTITQIQNAYDKWVREQYSNEIDKMVEVNSNVHPNELWHRYEMKWRNGEYT